MASSENSQHQDDVVPLLIGGRKIYTEETYDVFGPSAAQPIHKSANATVAHGQDAIDAAANAFHSWSLTTPAKRRDILLKAAEVLRTQAAELKEAMKAEAGADDAWAEFNIFSAQEALIDCASRITSVEGRIPALSNPESGGLIVKEPYGVVFAMAPWNAPYILGFRAVIWAIAAGNTVVFKGSERSPRCLCAVATVLQDAGLPDGVVNFISCSPGNAPALTKALIESPTVKKINFTGSTNVGRLVAKLAGANLKPILLELGGKAPAIVCADADLDVAAQQCVLGAFMYGGQICMSTERIIVDKSIRSALEDKLKEWTRRMFDSDTGLVLINDTAVSKNKGLVQDALAKGANLVHGNPDVTEKVNTQLRPIIVSNVKPGMDIYIEESFGPTVSIIEFETEDEALRIANDTEYGLSSAVFSRDLRKALRLARRIETGAVHINRMSVHDESVLPHGGAKSSGFGRFNTSMEEWVRTKNITYDI